MEAEESAAAKTKEEMESEISKAMLSRLDDFKQQADNLTLEGVRRVLEKDLGMERLSLDTHKKYIKQCLEKYFYGSDEKNTSKTEGKTANDSIQPVKQESASGETEDLQPADDLRNSSSDLNENLESSPALDGEKEADLEGGKRRNGSKQGNEINEDVIKKAIRKRAAYFRSNLEITLAKVRRLLEEDLELEKTSLDSYKSFISNEMDAILQSAEAVPAKKESKKGYMKKPNGRDSGKTSKVTKRASVDSESSDSENVSSGNEEDEDEEDVRKPKKRSAQKVKADTKGLKRQKISSGKSKASTAAKKKPVESDSEKSEEGDVGKSAEDDRSESADDQEVKVSKKSEKPAQVYGKQVEHLKSIIKSCGMGVPPAVYKRVKQVPESKREAQLIKELEEILEKEGLSSNPSEKDIKLVKKRKERAKELEGIDMSNIVSSSRRRSTFSYTPPPKPQIEVASDESEEGEEDEEENDEDSDEGNNDGEDSSGEGSDDDDAGEESD